MRPSAMRPLWHRQAIAQACATLAASVVAIPCPSSHPARAGTGTIRRAESSITIEVA